MCMSSSATTSTPAAGPSTRCSALPDASRRRTRELAEHIIEDADLLIRELQGIKVFAEQQLKIHPIQLTC